MRCPPWRLRPRRLSPGTAPTSRPSAFSGSGHRAATPCVPLDHTAGSSPYVADRRPVQDGLCTDDDDAELYRRVGLWGVEVLRLLAQGTELIRCTSETAVAPGAIYVLAARPECETAQTHPGATNWRVRRIPAARVPRASFLRFRTFARSARHFFALSGLFAAVDSAISRSSTPGMRNSAPHLARAHRRAIHWPTHR